MSLIINGTERDELIIGGSIFKYAGERFPIATANANTHNATYRGQDLGPFNETFASAIKNGTFTDMWVGDYFTVNKHTYKIAGFNYEYGSEENAVLANHLIMITDVLSNQAMNSSDTTAGGFTGSDMWNSCFPTVVEQLKTDFGSHLLTWNEYLTTGTDDKTANQGAFFPVQASMMNTVMYWGSPGQYSTSASNGTNYNIGIETKQLPIMKLHTDEQKGGINYTWLRDVHDSSSFACADNDGSAAGINAHYSQGVRAFFLID